MKITTLPVFSKLADENALPKELRERLPKGWKLSQHQLDTYKALTGNEYDVIFNTAMTGDGKSLAGQLAALVNGGQEHPIMSMYPTNELIDDQDSHLEKTIAHWSANIQKARLNSGELDQTMEEDDYDRRGDALMKIIRNGDFILSNPDIFHYVMHQFYTYPRDAPDRYSGLLTQKFRQLTFDEFHIFEAPQIVSVLNAMLFMLETGGQVRPHKFLFLSATPRTLMQEYLKRSGLRTVFVEGEYATQGNVETWRKILSAATIHFEPEPRVEAWLDMHLDDIVLPFFLQRKPYAKGAVIVNSRASAMRIYEKIKPLFEKHGLRVEANTGWTGRSRRKKSYDADLLIGTSTVDVGVDFQINFLVFESHNAGTFLQRLGRLGRHDYYQREGQKFAFQEYEAYAMLPDWTVAKLFTEQEGVPPLLQDGAEVDRQFLNRAIEWALPSTTEFEQYAQTWGKFQSIKVLHELARKPVREEYKDTRIRLEERSNKTFGLYLKKSFQEFKFLREERSILLNEALSFRGGSNFPCCVIDDSESGKEKFKVVDLISVIANYHLDYLSAENFYAAVQKEKLSPKFYEKQEPLGFFNLRMLRDFQKFVFHFNRDIGHWGTDEYGVVKARKGFLLDADFPGNSEINRKLSRREIPSLFCIGLKPQEIKRRLNLSLLFPVYEFKSDDGISGILALGRAALLLDARLRFSPVKCGGNAIIT